MRMVKFFVSVGNIINLLIVCSSITASCIDQVTYTLFFGADLERSDIFSSLFSLEFSLFGGGS